MVTSRIVPIWLKPAKTSAARAWRRSRPSRGCRQHLCLPLRRAAPIIEPRAHAPEAVEPGDHRPRRERRERLDDRAGGGLERARRGGHRRRHSARPAGPSPASSSPAQPQRRAPRSVAGPGDVGRRQAHRVAGVGLREHRHHQRRVLDPARHRPGDAAVVRRRIGMRPLLASGRTAAPGGGQADRAADVGAQVQRAVAAAAARRRRALDLPGFSAGSHGLRVSAVKLDRPEDSMP